MGWFSKAVSFVKNNASGIVHGVLDVAGFIPVVGAVADLANAAIYAAEGDYVNAALSAVSAIPGVGDAVAAASKTAKVVSAGVKIASNVKQGVRALDKIQDGLKVIKGRCTTGGNLLKKVDIKKAIEDIKKSFKKELLDGMDKVKDIAAKAKEKANEIATKMSDKMKELRCRTDPVDVVTGVVFNEYTDIELPGIIPLQWVRRYYSDNRRVGVLGHRIVLNYETEITAGERSLSVLLPSGRIIRVEADADESVNRTERFKLSRKDGGFEVYFYEEQLTYTYERVKQEQTVYSLTAIGDKAGHQISFSYEGDCLSGITDSAGRKISVQTDAARRILKVSMEKRDLVSYGYNTEGDLVSFKDALGKASKYKYNNHLLVQSTNRDGHSFCWEYDDTHPDARCIHAWGDGGTLEYYFEYHDGLTINTNPLGYHEKTYYNYHNLVTKRVDYEGNVTEYEYNKFEELICIKNAMKESTLYSYDDYGNILTKQEPSGAVTAYEYDAMGNALKITYPNQAVLRYEYQDNGRIKKVCNPDGTEREYSYNADNLICAIKDEAGNSYQLRYDTQGNLTELIQPDGNSGKWEYDEYGNCIQAVNPLGAEQKLTYDCLNRLIKAELPDQNVVSLRYNSYDEVIGVKDKQREVRYEYTWSGKLKSCEEKDRKIKYIYDAEEQLISVINEKRETYAFDYGGNGNIIKEKGFDGKEHTYRYDKIGRLIEVTLPDGSIKKLEYDVAGNLTSILYSDGSFEKFQYNVMGRIIKAENAHSSTEFELDLMGRIKKAVQDGITIDYEYNPLGQKTRVQSSLGASIEQHYNTNGDVSEISASFLGKTWNSKMQYNALGQEILKELPGDITSRWEYNKAGRLTVHSIKGGEQRSRTKRYQWDINNQLKTITDGGNRKNFYYDEVGNLAWAAFDKETIYRSMDISGNLYKTKNHTDRSYGKGGQLSKSATAAYQYDSLGNLTKKVTEEGTWHYTYGCNRFLKKVVRPDKKEITFQYDALGRRIAKSFDGKTTRFLWNGNNLLHEWEQQGDKEITSPITWLFNENSFIPLSKITEQEAYSVISDHLGTPFEMYDTHGKKVWGNELDIYGKIRVNEGNAGYCYFRFPGQYEDVETGLYYNRFRYYDPEDGIYTQKDPIGLAGGRNLYAYVSNPVIYIDPLGLSGIDIFRGMTDNNGKPKVGESARTLGARPNVDIPVDSRGMVHPGTGGISVAPTAEDLPKHRKPPSFGGTGKDPVWKMNTSDLGSDLIHVPDKPNHGTIQPAKSMSFEDYQKALAETQNKWEKVPCR